MSEDRTKVLVLRDEPDPIRKKQSNMEHVTLLLGVSAAVLSETFGYSSPYNSSNFLSRG